MNSFSATWEMFFQDPTVRFFGSQKPGSQSDMKRMHVHVGYIIFLFDGFIPAILWTLPGMFTFLVAIKCPCFDGASIVGLFVFDDHIRGNEADSADLFAT